MSGCVWAVYVCAVVMVVGFLVTLAATQRQGAWIQVLVTLAATQRHGAWIQVLATLAAVGTIPTSLHAHSATDGQPPTHAS